MKKLIILVIAVLLFMISGCGSHFQKTYSSYKSLFVSSMAFVNDGSFANLENVKKLQKVDLDELEKNVLALEELLSKMDDLAKTPHEKDVVLLTKADQSDLDTILEIRKRIDNLSDDDVWQLSYAFTGVSAAIDKYCEGK